MRGNSPEAENTTSICQELPGACTSPPQWLLLVPSGRFQGRDGRAWINDQPERIVDHLARNRMDIPVDWEHATHHKGPKGEEAPASGWIKELSIRDGAVWGRIEWTPRALNQIRNREYRYYSVAFDHEKDTGRVARIISTGLTNAPNLYTRALNQEGLTMMVSRQERPTALNREQAAIAKAFGNTVQDLDRRADAATSGCGDCARSLNREQESSSASIAAAFGNNPADLAKYADR